MLIVECRAGQLFLRLTTVNPTSDVFCTCDNRRCFNRVLDLFPVNNFFHIKVYLKGILLCSAYVGLVLDCRW